MVVAVRDLGCSESLLTKHIRANLGAAFSYGGAERILFGLTIRIPRYSLAGKCRRDEKSARRLSRQRPGEGDEAKAVRLLHL